MFNEEQIMQFDEKTWTQIYGDIWREPSEGKIFNIRTGIEYESEDAAIDGLLEDEEELIKKYQ